jgi:DNA-binding transcriptional ArsR family regulator
MGGKLTRNGPEAVFKALGHPARLTLVRTLQGGEHCVCDLVQAVGLGRSTTPRCATPISA